MDVTIIRKGRITAPRIQHFVTPLQYLIIKENGQKYLLLNLYNDREEPVTGVTLELSQRSQRGTNLGTRKVFCSVADGKTKTQFVLQDKILLNDACADVSVKLLSADYGSYRYAAEDSGLTLSHITPGTQRQTDPLAPEQIAAVKSRAVTERNFRLPRAVCIFVFAVMAVALLAVFLHLQSFKGYNDYFYYNKVQYRYENGDRSGESGIYVIGAKRSAKSVFIPEAVQGYPVTRIESYAFSFNQNLVELTVAGELIIEYNAFNNCNNLSKISIRNVTAIEDQAFAFCNSLYDLQAYNLSYIGYSAFEGCASLRSIDISNDKAVLSIGSDAFANCNNLTQVRIDQWIDFSFNSIIFTNCFKLQSLHLKNFNYDFQFGGISYPSHEQSVPMLFGIYNQWNTFYGNLQELIIDNCNAIAEYFCYNFNVVSVTINNLRSSEVGREAFRNSTTLQTLNVPVTFTRVEEYAFANTAITYFDGGVLNHIGDFAFSDCSLLQLFRLENNAGLAYLGEGVFSGCSSLWSIYIPAAVNTLPDSTFEYCTSLSDFKVGGTLDAIGNFAFSGCIRLKEIPLSQAVSIGTEAFRGCVALQSLSFSPALSVIGEDAFNGCTALTSVTVPPSVTAIGRGAFASCSALREITVPFIGGTAYNNSYFSYIFGAQTADDGHLVPRALEKVTILSASTIVEKAFYKCASIRQIVIQSDFTLIGPSAFEYCSKLDGFILPSTLMNIGTNAFANCYKLYELYNLSTLPILRGTATHGSVGYYALKVYASLWETPIAKAWVDDFVFSRDEDGNWFMTDYTGSGTDLDFPQFFIYNDARLFSYEIIQYMLFDHPSVRSITVSGGATSVGRYAFSACTNLRSVTISYDIGSVGLGAFSGCTSLQQMELPYIGGSAGSNRYIGYLFGSTDYQKTGWVPYSLKTVTVSKADDVPQFAFYGCEGLTAVNLPVNCKIIGTYAFAQCRSLRTINLTSSLTVIGEYAFADCSSLTSVTVPERVSSVGRGAFAGCDSLRDITLPYIGGSASSDRFLSYIFGAFNYTDHNAVPNSLRTVTVTTGTIIPDYAFYNCSGLQTVVLPPALETIGQQAFYGCQALHTVKLPETLRSIGIQAFRACTSLQEIVFPASLQTIGQMAFFNCMGLKRVTVYGRPAIQSEAFYNCQELLEIYNLGSMVLTAGSTDHGYIAYYAVAVYSSLSDAPMQEVTVGGIVFNYYGDNWVAVGYAGNASALELGSFTYQGKAINAYSVKQNAFQSAGLTSLTIGKEVTSIGDHAFAYNYDLRTVDMASSVIKQISQDLFLGCSALSDITLPQGLTQIDANAFNGCYQLYAVTVPAGVTKIGDYAFYGCYALRDVTNLSRSLTIAKGAASNGYIGYYALRINTSASASPLATAESDGYRFMLYETQWYLISVETEGYFLSLPASFVYNQTTVSSYILLESALNVRFFDSIFIPYAVTRLQTDEPDLWLNINAVYYQGGGQQWADMISAATNSALANKTVYYYSSPPA